MNVDLIIIGGGPAGLFAAIQTKLLNKNIDVLILEKNKTPGKKLLMTGAGQCNLTQDGNIKNFLKHYGDNKNFIRTALYKFNNKNLIDFFKKREISFVTTEKGKVFPESFNASDILDALISECSKKGIAIHSNQAVRDVKTSKENKFIINTKNTQYTCHFLVIAAGGKSYPTSGSSGDGYKFARSFGHNIINPSPALTPVYINKYLFSDLAGISLTNLNLSLWRNNSLVERWSGDLLFTHKGLSGPAIINFSRYIQANDVIKLHFVNTYNESVLNKEIVKKTNNNGKLLLKNLLRDYSLPQRLITKLMEIANIEEDTKAAYLKKDQRNELVKILSALPLEVERLGGFNEAMVTSGGVDLKEIKKETMESRLVPNLYAIGEVLDIDGDTGGYNLQAAFSTAFLAANSINNKYKVNK